MAIAKKTSKSLIPVRKPAPKKTTAPKARTKAAPKPAPKPAAPAVSTRPVPAQVASTARSDKARKQKLVRDSFTIPKIEFAVLQELKQRAGKSGTPAKKSELLRAGIKALAAMSDAAFAAALGAVPPIKTGRPAKE